MHARHMRCNPRVQTQPLNVSVLTRGHSETLSLERPYDTPPMKALQRGLFRISACGNLKSTSCSNCTELSGSFGYRRVQYSKLSLLRARTYSKRTHSVVREHILYCTELSGSFGYGRVQYRRLSLLRARTMYRIIL